MKDDLKTNSLPPSDQDAVLDRYLESLPVLAPCPGFEERVMSRVLVPAPRWLQSMRRCGRSLVQRRRVWWLAGGLAGASAASVSIITALVMSNTAAISGFFGWVMSGVGLAVWRGTLGIASQFARDAYAVVSTLNVSGTGLFAAGVSSLALLAFNAWMLYRLMQPAQGMRSEANAVH